VCGGRQRGLATLHGYQPWQLAAQRWVGFKQSRNERGGLAFAKVWTVGTRCRVNVGGGRQVEAAPPTVRIEALEHPIVGRAVALQRGPPEATVTWRAAAPALRLTSQVTQPHGELPHQPHEGAQYGLQGHPHPCRKADRRSEETAAPA
jgi:hypothetical protein